MKNYSDFLKKLGFKIDYIDFKEYENLFNLINNDVEVEYIDTVDNYLEKDLEKIFKIKHKIQLYSKPNVFK